MRIEPFGINYLVISQAAGHIYGPEMKGNAQVECNGLIQTDTTEG